VVRFYRADGTPRGFDGRKINGSNEKEDNMSKKVWLERVRNQNQQEASRYGAEQ